jgi:hypothetical protein
MRSKFLNEVRAAGFPAAPDARPVVTDTDLAPLPATAQRYLRFMGVVGRPRDWSLRMSFRGRFRTRHFGPWRACRTWQYNTRLALARIFHIRIRLAGVPVLARDTYLRGHGRMLVRLLDLVTVADGSGTEFDAGELVTYLNDAIFFAPSLILGAEAVWSGVDHRSFDVRLTDGATTVTARVSVDERGAPVDFSTTDRFCSDPANPNRLLRARWTTPITAECRDGRPVSARGQAIWHLAQGASPYADFTLVPGTLAFNVPPGA